MFVRAEAISQNMNFIFMLLTLCIVLAGCSLREPDHFTNKKMRVQEEKIVQQISVHEFDDAMAYSVSEHYRKHGKGAMSVSLTYDPKAKSNTAMIATNEAARIKKALRNNGVQQADVRIIPAHGLGEEQQLIVSYMSYDALAPEDCELMAGLETREVNAEADYEMGCSVETYLSRQIARPKDLLGQESANGANGRRVVNQLEVYQSGEPNELLDGETASGE